MVRSGAEPQVPRLRRIGGLLVLQHPQGLIGEVPGQVIALLGAVRLFDEPVVLDQIRIELVGLAAEKSVEPVEPLLQRPFGSAAAAGDVLFGHVVVLADPERAVPVVLEHLADCRALRGQSRCGAGKTVGGLGDCRAAVDMMVASGQEAGPGRRTQRGCVPLCVSQSVVGQSVHDRHVDAPAERRPRRQSGVVVEHHQDVGGAFGSLLENVR